MEGASLIRVANRTLQGKGVQHFEVEAGEDGFGIDVLIIDVVEAGKSERSDPTVEPRNPMNWLSLEESCS